MCLLKYSLQCGIIGSGKGLVRDWWQAIIWSNNDPVNDAYMRHRA